MSRFTKIDRPMIKPENARAELQFFLSSPRSTGLTDIAMVGEYDHHERLNQCCILGCPIFTNRTEEVLSLHFIIPDLTDFFLLTI